MAEVVKITYQLRRGASATWTKNNPLLAAGEPGYEIDTHKVKIGDGTSKWKDLPYIGEHNIVSYVSHNDFPSVGNVNYREAVRGIILKDKKTKQKEEASEQFFFYV